MVAFLKRALAGAVLLGLIVWAADWLLLRNKIARDAGYGEVEVRYRLAIHLKNKRIEQRIEKPQMVECVESLLPHYNEEPCWYLARHPDQTQEFDGGRWHFWYEE